jgi:hypothetical protein
MFFIPEINPHCILSQIYALFTECYYALLFFVVFCFVFIDMHYNTMIPGFSFADIFVHLKIISNDICVSQRIEHLGKHVPNSSSKIDYRKEYTLILRKRKNNYYCFPLNTGNQGNYPINLISE